MKKSSQSGNQGASENKEPLFLLFASTEKNNIEKEKNKESKVNGKREEG